MPTLSYPGTPGTTLYAGLPTPSVGGLITTLSLVNTSGSTQAADFVSPMFGHPFVEGDLPAGEYPAFTLTDDTPVAATVYSDVAWGDDSKKFCGVILRSPASIAGSGTQTINVNSAGSAPAASARTLSDLNAADLKIELTGSSNLSGVWTASLNTAITDATDIVVIGDGPAGKVYRIGGPFKQSGAAHGQLYCWHYAAILQDTSGNLMGIRYLGRVAQPFTDITSPAVAKREFTAVLKSGATTIRTLQGVNASESVQGTITLPHYASIYTCGTDGKWDFVQGGGSASADCTVRVVQDKTYFVKSRMVPPYDVSLSITDQASINYVPMCSGGMTRATGSTGEREDIGIFPSWYARHIIAPTVNTERHVRVAGLASGGWRTGLRASTTLMPPAVHDTQPSYTGLGTVQPTYRYWDAPFAVGVNPIPSGHLWLEEYDGHHRAQGSYFPYLLTAEPQFLDQLQEQANSFILIIPPGNGTEWKTTLPINGGTKLGAFQSRDPFISTTSYKTSGLLFRQDLTRYAAWMLRDVAEAAAISPTVCPKGTAIKSYFTDSVEQNYAAWLSYISFMATSYREDGLFGLLSTEINPIDAPWCQGYLCNSLAHQYAITGSANALATATHFAKFWAAINGYIDIAAGASLNASTFFTNNDRIERIEDMVFQITDCTLTYDAATNTISKSGANSGFSVTNGDVLGVDPARISTAGARDRMYAVNSTGATWQLSLTPGGSVVDITSNGNHVNPFMALQSFAPRFSYENATSSQGYIANIRGAMRHLEAVGISLVNPARVNADARIVTAGTTFTSDPKNAMTASYPA